MNTILRQILIDNCSLELLLKITFLIIINKLAIWSSKKYSRKITFVILMLVHLYVQKYHNIGNLLVHIPSEEQSYNKALDLLRSRMNGYSFLVSTGIVVPIIEELYMEFVLTSLLHITSNNKFLSITLCSCYFAFLHVISWYSDWTKFLFVFILRIVGYRLFSGSILLTHIIQNLLCVSIILILEDTVIS